MYSIYLEWKKKQKKKKELEQQLIVKEDVTTEPEEDVDDLLSKENLIRLLARIKQDIIDSNLDSVSNFSEDAENNALQNNPMYSMGYARMREEIFTKYQPLSCQPPEGRIQSINSIIDEIAADAAMLGGAAGIIPLNPLIFVAMTVEEIKLLDWCLQIVMKIAVIQGYQLTDTDFILRVLPATLGITHEDLTKQVGISLPRQIMMESGVNLGKKVGVKVMRQIIFKKVPGKVFGRVNQIVGVVLAKKAGKRIVTLSKFLPFVGAIIGGAINWNQVKSIGRNAIPYFPCYDVFFSHDWGINKENHEVVLKIVHILQSVGVKVWFDENQLRPGDTLEEELKKAIDDSKVVIVGVTEGYKQKVGLGNNYCSLEYQYAIKSKLNDVIPVRLERTPVSGNLASINHLMYHEILVRTPFYFELDVLDVASILSYSLELPDVEKRILHRREALQKEIEALINKPQKEPPVKPSLPMKNNAEKCCSIQ